MTAATNMEEMGSPTPALNLQRASLAYNEMSVGNSGSVVSRAEKLALREKKGFCKECVGMPVLLFNVKKALLNPLWVTREPREVPGECSGGVCFVCHPERDPNRHKRGNRRNSGRISHNIRTPTNNRSEASTRRVRDLVMGSGSPPLSGSGHQRDLWSPSLGPSNSSPAMTTPTLPQLGLPSLDATTDAVASPNHPRDTMSQPRTRQSRRMVESRNARPGAAEDSHRQTRSSRQRGSNANIRPLSSKSMPNVEGIYIPESPGEVESAEFARSSEFLSSEIASSEVYGSAEFAANTELATSAHRNPSGNLPSEPSPPDEVMNAMVSRAMSPRKEPSEGSLDMSMASETSATMSASVASASAEVLPNLANTASQPVERAPSPHQTWQEQSQPAAAGSNMSQQEVASILDGIDSLVSDMASMGNSEFLADILLGGMREHSANAEVQSHCLQVIWDVCKDSDPNKEAMMHAGAPEDVISALRRFSDNTKVQEKGCGALWSIGVSNDNRIVLIRAGACQQVVSALKAHAASETLARAAIGAMRTLSPEAEARDIFKAKNAPKWTADAMVLHPKCVSVQRDGCALLSNCAVNIEKQIVTIVPLEEMNAVVQAIANHPCELSVMQGACFALKNYTHEEKNCRTLQLCKGVDGLLMHAAQFEESPACQDDASTILEHLHLSRSMDASLEQEVHDSFLSIVQNDANGPQTPKRILDSMIDNDWSPRLISIGLQLLGRVMVESKSQPEPQVVHIGAKSFLEQLLQLCQRFYGHVPVCEELFALLTVVAEEESRRRDVVEAGACNLIFKSLEHQTSERQVVANALSLLKLLVVDTEGRKQLPERMGLVTDAIYAHPSCEEIQMDGIAIISFLD